MSCLKPSLGATAGMPTYHIKPRRYKPCHLTLSRSLFLSLLYGYGCCGCCNQQPWSHDVGSLDPRSALPNPCLLPSTPSLPFAHLYLSLLFLSPPLPFVNRLSSVFPPSSFSFLAHILLSILILPRKFFSLCFFFPFSSPFPSHSFYVLLILLLSFCLPLPLSFLFASFLFLNYCRIPRPLPFLPPLLSTIFSPLTSMLSIFLSFSSLFLPFSFSFAVSF
jgi:hypothetical protein